MKKQPGTRTTALAVAAFVMSTAALAADGIAEAPMRDPWVPPSVRQAASAPLTRGTALQAQVQAKLKASFDAADVEKRGSITLEQARAAPTSEARRPIVRATARWLLTCAGPVRAPESSPRAKSSHCCRD
jgi:hypothetical protein